MHNTKHVLLKKSISNKCQWEKYLHFCTNRLFLITKFIKEQIFSKAFYDLQYIQQF